MISGICHVDCFVKFNNSSGLINLTHFISRETGFQAGGQSKLYYWIKEHYIRKEIVLVHGLTVQLKNADTKEAWEEKETGLVEVNEMVCMFGLTSTIKAPGSPVSLKF